MIVIQELLGNLVIFFEDLSKAAELGSAFAKTMVVQMNPCAAMCNKMLAEAINKLKGEPL